MASSRVKILDPSVSSSERLYRSGRIPRYGIAVLEALQLSNPDTKLLESLNETEWNRLLHFCDTSQLTLILGHFCGPSLPERVRARIDLNYRNNAERFARLNASLFEILDCLQSRGIDAVTLKGHAHSPHFTPDPLARVQGDIDLWCRGESVFEAQRGLGELGYLSLCKAEGRHLPPMARPSAWQWRGDYFAPDLPIPVDLHYSLWDEKKEHIAGPPEHEFWDRRLQILVDGRAIPVLCQADTLAFATLHLLMHVLHGDLRLQRAWEIAHFVHTRADDEDFWRGWQQLHPPALRQLEAIVIALTADWFGCRYATPLEEEKQKLPDDVKLWMERYAVSPVEALFTPNKHELWLNMALLNARRDKIDVFVRRLFPVRLVGASASRSTDDAGRSVTMRRGLKFVVSRSLHHSRTLVPSLAGGINWWWIRQGLGRDFVFLQVSSALFDFGESIFFLLFNLYLLERGLNEKFLGQVSAAMTVGTVAGAIPGVALTRRAGLRAALLVALLGGPATAVLRTIALNQSTILLSAFLNGLCMSVWAISFAPAISALTDERNRPLAFSLASSLGIGLGALAGLVGGRLPGFLLHVIPSFTSLEGKRAALLVGSGIAALGALPALRLQFRASPPAEKKAYPRSPFILCFLTALFVWSIATGAFNPFFNAYFSQYLHTSVERIGLIYSYSQLAQVVGVLLAPLVIKKIGAVRGVSSMQAATAVMLGLLALGLTGPVAAVLYTAYMAFQYMSEPGLLSMLMNRVKPSERSGASALNFLVISGAGSLSALASGAAITRFGYSAVLASAAALATVAAALFWTLLREDT
ncbi:MAG: MFS transporter [Bryobacteraceae bacterium]